MDEVAIRFMTTSGDYSMAEVEIFGDIVSLRLHKPDDDKPSAEASLSMAQARSMARLILAAPQG